MSPSDVDVTLIDLFLRDGYDVVVAYHLGEDREFLRSRISAKERSRVHFETCDLESLGEVQAFQQLLLEKWYPISAACITFGSETGSLGLEDLSTETLLEEFKADFLPSFHLAKCLLPLMRSAGSKILVVEKEVVSKSRRLGLVGELSQGSKGVLWDRFQMECKGADLKRFTLDVRAESEEETVDAVNHSAMIESVRDFLANRNPDSLAESASDTSPKLILPGRF